ncbi:MAG: response regulator [Phormidesmis sp. RL_2_1]|nr:response regulator [Phormidesmis sp. RL_2_1]
MRVLVIDDESDVEMLFRQKFRREIKAQTIDFDFALSAEEALTYLKSPTAQAEITLILSDINMPGMNGLELLRVIKEHYPELNVFMVTAYGDERSEQTALAYGASGFLNKPVNFNQLKQDILRLAS